MNKVVRFLAILLITFLAAGCSSTTLTGSWRSPELTRSVAKIYIVGISKHETHRRIFEDEFGQQLQQYGTRAYSSYKDLKDVQSAEIEAILDKVRAAGADAVLMTRIMGKRTEEVVNPGRVTGFNYGPSFYGGGRSDYYPSPYYRNYRDYYDRRSELTYEPSTITRYQIITLESNLYDATSGELLWAAQLETVMEKTMEKMIKDFIEVVTRDLAKQGVI